MWDIIEIRERGYSTFMDNTEFFIPGNKRPRYQTNFCLTTVPWDAMDVSRQLNIR